MSKYFALLLFLTLGMIGYHNTTATVTDVSHRVVTLSDSKHEYSILEDEAWRVGDMAECIVRDADNSIVHAQYVWRIPWKK